MCLGLVVNGTDFVARKGFIPRVRKSAVMHECEAWVAAAWSKDPGPARTGYPHRIWLVKQLSHPEVVDTLVRAIWARHRSSTKVPIWEGTHVLAPTPVEARSCAIAQPSLLAHRQISGNLAYWSDLQGQIQPDTNQTTEPALGGRDQCGVTEHLLRVLPLYQ